MPGVPDAAVGGRGGQALPGARPVRLPPPRRQPDPAGLQAGRARPRAHYLQYYAEG